MSALYIIFMILSIVVAVALIFIVVIQNSKGGGLSNTFGAASVASQVMGARRSSEQIHKLTWYLAAALGVLVFLANISGTGNTDANAADLEIQRSIDGAYDAANTTLPSFDEQGGATQGGADQGGAPQGGADQSGAPQDAAPQGGQ